MTDQYIIDLVENNPKYLEKYKTNKDFHKAIDEYVHHGGAETVVRLFFELSK